MEGKQRSLEGFYKQLHAYVRTKLMAVYNPQGAGITEDGPLPANVLGNMWAQTWGHIEDIVKPFNDTTILDVTDQMVEQGYTVDQMFKLSEEFFITLGFPCRWVLGLKVKMLPCLGHWGRLEIPG